MVGQGNQPEREGETITTQVKDSLNTPFVLLILGILAPVLIFLVTLAGFFFFTGN